MGKVNPKTAVEAVETLDTQSTVEETNTETAVEATVEEVAEDPETAG